VSAKRSRAWVRWLRRAAIAVVVAVVLFVFGWTPYWLAGVFTVRKFHMPDRENAGLTPASFDLASEDITFHAPDGVELKGWWVPAPPEPVGTVVMAHGLNRSRIEMIKKVPFVHARGWNALLFDLRHHGESGGESTTFGVKERGDVEAAVQFARERSPGPVVAWGVSLGAASVMLAAADDPGIDGVICDSSWNTLRLSAQHHLHLFRSFAWWLRIFPVWPLADEAVFWMGRRGSFDPSKSDVVAAARHLGERPALFVANSGDRRMPKEIAFELQKAAGPRAEVLIVPGESHGGAWRDGTEAYKAAVDSLLEAAQKRTGPTRLAAHEKETVATP
jgi:pimeloyl-ACP methyl ester carboxylesterase